MISAGMTLLNGPNTPFGRMALASALELGIEVENRVINVFEAEFLDAINPMRQIPTLVLGDSRALFDSRVICAYFSSLRPERRFIGVDGDWDVQARWSLVLGLMETAVSRVMETRRAEGERSGAALEKYDRRMARVVIALEAAADDLCSHHARIDRLAAAVALEYIDFRLSRGWRDHAPRLGVWLEKETSRPCLSATRPTDPLRGDK